MKSVASRVVIYNRGSKIFLDFEELPPLLEHYSNFVWVEEHDLKDDHELNAQQQKIEDLGYGVAFRDSLQMILPPHNQSQQILDKLHNEILYLKRFQCLFVEALTSECPDIKFCHYPYMASLLSNCEIVGRDVGAQRESVHIYPVALTIVMLITESFLGSPPKDTNFSHHFPVILKYPKYCFACKRDHKESFPDLSSSKTVRKTKYGCEGCSLFFRTEIRLCVLCFKRFHMNISYYMAKNAGGISKLVLPPPFDLNKPQIKTS